jgi:predicted secreted protein
MVREISWSHNPVIMEKCKDDLERVFYLRMSKRKGSTARLSSLSKQVAKNRRLPPSRNPYVSAEDVMWKSGIT